MHSAAAADPGLQMISLINGGKRLAKVMAAMAVAAINGHTVVNRVQALRNAASSPQLKKITGCMTKTANARPFLSAKRPFESIWRSAGILMFIQFGTSADWRSAPRLEDFFLRRVAPLYAAAGAASADVCHPRPLGFVALVLRIHRRTTIWASLSFGHRVLLPCLGCWTFRAFDHRTAWLDPRFLATRRFDHI